MKKVLIALDYNLNSQQVAEGGYEFAKSMRAKVILLHVLATSGYNSLLEYSPLVGFSGFRDIDYLQVVDVGELQKATKFFLEDSKNQIGDSRIQTMLAEGEDYAESIVKASTELKVDFIVMGKQGPNHIDKYDKGNVTVQVLENSELPVMVIPTNVKDT